ncbi:HET-domain-containing protein [Lophiostoma macrostomum CBS 122681]|uniref:HET-domain-containing protein n=1 Tax=Lophiostoma macrostomum CBS 122681 TaxID=1314788 RepID=A0A6A6SPG2_9PLEO|nr:HET-domain-containing protein [Lophiostoma macrostomum CBS 122681]
MDKILQKLSMRRHGSLIRSRKNREDSADQAPSDSNKDQSDAGECRTSSGSNDQEDAIADDPGLYTAREEFLCAPCRRFIKSLTSFRPTTAHDSKLFWKSDTINASETPCRLCRFLRVVAGEDRAGYSCYCWAIERLNPESCDFGRSSGAALLTGNGAVNQLGLRKRVKKSNEMEPRRIHPRYIDYCVIREWMDFCAKAHKQTCQIARGTPVRGFKVLDCHTRRVVQPEKNCRFVALSYVWGVTIAPERSGGLFPPTIEDSIRVTLKLGMKYLWVDKYCIDQSDATEKHGQIQNMDRIYSMAALTIVAVAGKDPSYGLPGVSTRPRQEQAYLSLAELELMEIPSDLSSLRECSWASRGWTLQEAYLSNRRLIFSDREVSFLCNHMYCQESVKQILHHRRNAPWDGLDGAHLFGVFPSLHHSRFNTDQILTEYTKRNLSFDSDALNACLGILKAKRPMHWQAMPIIQSAYSKRFTLDLQWMHVSPDFQPRLLPDISRSEFPTWSWTSIRGEKMFPLHRSADADHCSISAPTVNGQWMDVDEWVSKGADPTILRPSLRLCVTGYVVKPRFVTGDWMRDVAQIHPHELFTGGPGFWALWSLGGSPGQGYPDGSKTFTRSLTDITLALRVIRDLRDQRTPDALDDAVGLFIQLGNRCETESNPRTYPVMLILKPHGDHYKRVGITNWGNEAYLVENGRPHSNLYGRAGMAHGDGQDLGIGTFKTVIMPPSSPITMYLPPKDTLYME